MARPRWPSAWPVARRASPTTMGSEKIEKQYGDRDHGADWRGMTGSQRHIEENDLVFGAKKKLLQAAQDMRQEADYAVMGVAVNCGPALMGDDIEGICQSAMDIPVCVSDASGFNGDADRGWSDAMISLLRKVPHFSEKKQAGKINVIGPCILDPASDERGNKVLFIPGCQPMKYKELARLSDAEMNLVVHPRGLAVVR